MEKGFLFEEVGENRRLNRSVSKKTRMVADINKGSAVFDNYLSSLGLLALLANYESKAIYEMVGKVSL
jgi:hypothetical protein